MALVRSSLTRPFTTLFRDIEKEKAALRESEESASKKIKAILDPKGDIGALSLGDIIDREVLQSVMEEFYKLTKIGGAMVDISGNILVSAGWQDICIKFHRCYPDTLKNCLESDTILSSGVPPGTFKAYRCKNNMWDMVTPIEVAGRHLGNIFIGQFFYEDEIPDYDLFRGQARQYGFDEKEYLEALDRVPRLSRETVDAAMTFFTRLAGMISSLSYSNISLSRTLSRQEEVLLRLGENEIALKERNQYISTILETTRDGFWLLDKQGRVMDANEAYCHMTGYPKSELLKLTISDLDLDEKPDAIAARIKRIIENGSERFETRHRRKNGSFFDVELSVSWQADNFERFVCFCRDITERKLAEKKHIKTLGQLQQAQKMESVGRLAGGVAHDFNNMLGVILGHTDMILEELDPALPIHADLEEIRKAAQRSANLTRQLLAFARKQTVAPRVLDLNKTLEGMLKMLERLIGEDIDLEWLPGRDLWEVNMDPSQIDQILANLCINARDAIADVGRITIETSTAAFDEDYCLEHDGFVPGEFVMLTVSDDGCGMDRETLSQVFEPFFTTKELGKGTGLGLATVYGIVKQNNGFINAYSEPGQGTIFRIYLPRHRDKPGEIHEKGPAETAVRGHETILLVEDEPAILSMTTMMLKRLGYTVLTASTPGEAIRLARENAEQINLLMTDVVMPEMNGRDLAKKLLSLYPNLRCLFMSGYTANVIAHHGVLDKGINFIQKPFSKLSLAKVLKKSNWKDKFLYLNFSL